MKLMGLILTSALLVTSSALATTYTGQSTVLDVSNGDIDYAPSANSGDYITLFGLTTAGTCAKRSSDGRVKLFVRDDERGRRMLATATAALLSGKTVSYLLDDTKKLAGNNNCLLQSITIQVQ